VDREQASRMGLPCGGRLELVIEHIDSPAPIRALLEHVDRGDLIIRRLCLDTGEASLHPAAATDVFEYGDANLTKVYGPAWHMLLIGAGELARYVAQIGRMLDYRVTVCDPRDDYALDWTAEGVERTGLMPDDAVRGLADHPRSVVLTLAHDPKLDDMALMEALDSRAFYVGALGSERTSATRLERLADLGLGPETLARLHAPVGLPIGSHTPAEIAVAITAEITAERNRAAVAGSGNPQRSQR
ncbi:MAG: XdhC family protein, partial [Chromatiales bacterium]|jgi:xanthine dehydrogenase accessory factor